MSCVCVCDANDSLLFLFRFNILSLSFSRSLCLLLFFHLLLFHLLLCCRASCKIHKKREEGEKKLPHSNSERAVFSMICVCALCLSSNDHFRLLLGLSFSSNNSRKCAIDASKALKLSPGNKKKKKKKKRKRKKWAEFYTHKCWLIK